MNINTVDIKAQLLFRYLRKFRTGRIKLQLMPEKKNYLVRLFRDRQEFEIRIEYRPNDDIFLGKQLN